MLIEEVLRVLTNNFPLTLMKIFHLLLCIASLIGLPSSSLHAQKDVKEDSILSTIPYGKILHMSSEELLNNKFKFNSEKNQYTLQKKNGLKVAASIIGALGDTPTNYIPDINDYHITIQEGESGPAFIEVIFYDTNLYHQILTFGKDHGLQFLETNSGLLDKKQFNYADYSFALTNTVKSQSSTQTSTRDVHSHLSTAKETTTSTAHDESYNIYTFTIYTGIEPSSDYIMKQKEKSLKRDTKGKKKGSAADFM